MFATLRKAAHDARVEVPSINLMPVYVLLMPVYVLLISVHVLLREANRRARGKGKEAKRILPIRKVWGDGQGSCS